MVLPHGIIMIIFAKDIGNCLESCCLKWSCVLEKMLAYMLVCISRCLVDTRQTPPKKNPKQTTYKVTFSRVIVWICIFQKISPGHLLSSLMERVWSEDQMVRHCTGINRTQYNLRNISTAYRGRMSSSWCRMFIRSWGMWQMIQHRH